LLKVECVRGDITAQSDVDAIVNAANAHLAPGGGVAGAIHRAAGPQLYEECKGLAPIRTGSAVLTKGYKLPVRWCIHTLGPVYASSPDAAAELAACYDSILTIAAERDIARIATPAISTGVFGYPVDEAADVAMEAVTTRGKSLQSIELVRFVLWSEHDYDVHVRAAERVGAG
jgi:O-acetyl-ADP-ribose deacetylase (regulator of RNase III)